MGGGVIIELIILRQEHQGGFLYHIIPFFKPIIGMKITSTSDMFHRSYIFMFKEIITTIQGQRLNCGIQKGWNSLGSI